MVVYLVLPLSVQPFVCVQVKVVTYLAANRLVSQPRMFSQFRQAVESLAQPQDNPPDGRSQSPDPLRQSSAHLAESALINLRKSIAAQRIASPTPAQQNTHRPRSASPGPSSATKSTGDSGLRKSTLEDRLRASFAASESSASPNPSTPTPHAVPVTQHPLSPTSTDSPRDTTPSADHQAEERGHADDALAPPSELNGATPPIHPQPDPACSAADSTDAIHTDAATDFCVDVTLTQQAPQQPPMQQSTQASELIDADPSGEESIEAEPEPMMSVDSSKDADVEVLQKRLKLVEQRFLGKSHVLHIWASINIRCTRHIHFVHETSS